MVFFTTVMVALAGGYLFSLISMPVPWMLGPLTAVLLFNQVLKQPTAWPFFLREVAQIFLGYVMGNSFTPEAGLVIIKSIPSMVLANGIIIGCTMLIGYYLAKLLRISSSSAIIGCIPGGMSQMILLCDDITEADVSVVAFMQSIRLITVVFLVPFLVLHGISSELINNSVVGSLSAPLGGAVIPSRLLLYILLAIVGGFVAKKLRVPTPYLLGSMLVIAISSVAGADVPTMPSLLVIAAQVSFGAYLGNNIRIESLGDWKKMLSLTILSSLIIISIAFLIGYFFTRWQSLDLLTAFLALAPGGMSEMAITAITVNAELSTVTSYQLFRILFIILFTPPFLKWILQNRKKMTSNEQS